MNNLRYFGNNIYKVMEMKKIFLILILIFVFVGCNIANTPTSKVEELLGNYQRLDKNINIDYYNLANDEQLSDDLKNEYNNLIKEQYQNLSYEIKEEEIDGDKAIVTASIEVKNYKDIIRKYNKNEYQNDEYHKLIVNSLKSTNIKVNYTINFTLTKDNNDDWNIDELSNETKEKLLGIN